MSDPSFDEARAAINQDRASAQRDLDQAIARLCGAPNARELRQQLAGIDIDNWIDGAVTGIDPLLGEVVSALRALSAELAALDLQERALDAEEIGDHDAADLALAASSEAGKVARCAWMEHRARHSPAAAARLAQVIDLARWRRAHDRANTSTRDEIRARQPGQRRGPPDPPTPRIVCALAAPLVRRLVSAIRRVIRGGGDHV